MRTLVLAAVLLALAAPASHAGSDTPPEGPPWVRDLAEAQDLALKKDLPIFLYFTKTY
jgi:hypothetical protein